MTMPHLMNCQHRDDSWCLDCVKAEWERTNAEIERLNAIVERLPKTADGLPVVNGDVVFSETGRKFFVVGEYALSADGVQRKTCLCYSKNLELGVDQ
jgi:hypothetical protein